MPTRVTEENESTAYFLTKQTADIQYVNQQETQCKEIWI